MTASKADMPTALLVMPLPPKQSGKLTILSRATNEKDEVQPFSKEIGWNRGGYKYNGIDEVTIEVVS